MGGVDKGLVELDGRPMVAHVIARLGAQVGSMLVNANQNAERYAALGYPVVPDAVGGFAGPLAGLHAGLAQTKTPYAVTVPCDSPFLPENLVARLSVGLERQRRAACRRSDVRSAASGVRARARGRAPAPCRLPVRRRAQDRRVVRDAARRRSPVRRLCGRVPQHQYARRARRGLPAVLIQASGDEPPRSNSAAASAHAPRDRCVSAGCAARAAWKRSAAATIRSPLRFAAHVTLVFPFASTLSVLQIGDACEARRCGLASASRSHRRRGRLRLAMGASCGLRAAGRRSSSCTTGCTAASLAPFLRSGVRLCAARHDRPRGPMLADLREHASRSARRAPASARRGAALAVNPRPAAGRQRSSVEAEITAGRSVRPVGA